MSDLPSTYALLHALTGTWQYRDSAGTLRSGILTNPGQAAKAIRDSLREYYDGSFGQERPHGEAGTLVTAGELERALTATFVVRPVTGGKTDFGYLVNPADAAESVLRAIVVARQDAAALEEMNVRGGVTGATTEDDCRPLSQHPDDVIRSRVHGADCTDPDCDGGCVLATVGADEDEPGGTRIATWQLADWLKNHEVAIGPYTGRVEHPEALAETILEDVTGEAHPMPVDAEIHCPGCTCHITGQIGFAPPDRPVKVLLAVQDLFARIDKNSRKRVLDWLMSEISEPPPRWP